MSKNHGARLPDAIWDFQDKMIASGRFRGRSAVTLYAYQHLMKAEGYEMTGDVVTSSDPIIGRMVGQVRKLHSEHTTLKINRTKFHNQVKTRQEWLGERYPVLLDLSIIEFIKKCTNDTLSDFIEGGE